MLRHCAARLKGSHVPCRLGGRNSSFNILSSVGAQARLFGTAVEDAIVQKLRSAITAAEHVTVQDASGGCGSMYNIEVIAEEFRGLSVVKQHQMVTKVLKEEIKHWHGFVLNTKAPTK